MIPLGFICGTGEPLSIPIGHTVIVGQTQAAGKTTALEAMANRSPGCVIAFLTKRGEGSFRIATPMTPYFRECMDWREMCALLEVVHEKKLDSMQKLDVRKLCQAGELGRGKNFVEWNAPNSMEEMYATVKRVMPHVRGMHEPIYYEIEDLLKILIADLAVLRKEQSELKFAAALNVMDLIGYRFPVQAIIVRSVLEMVYAKARNTRVVIPEAHKFASRLHGSPVRTAAESFIREGAALKNFLWVDSQDFEISPVLLGQMKVWILGVQRDRPKIERTLAVIPYAGSRGIRAEHISTLGLGEFIVCFEREMHKVYVQPAWMTASHAQAIAMGEESVESARAIVREVDEAKI
jgi:hypothetical protein